MHARAEANAVMGHIGGVMATGLSTFAASMQAYRQSRTLQNAIAWADAWAARAGRAEAKVEDLEDRLAMAEAQIMSLRRRAV